MTRIKRLGVLLTTLVFAFHQASFANLTWTNIDFENWPFQVNRHLTDVVTFKSHIFLTGQDGIRKNPTDPIFWKSADVGESWTAVSFPIVFDRIERLVSTPTHLFATAAKMDGVSHFPVETRVFFTTDGETWNEIPLLKNKTFYQAVQYKNYWYFTTLNAVNGNVPNQILKSQLQNNPPKFDNVSPPEPQTTFFVLAHFKDRLYTFYQAPVFNSDRGRVSYTLDGQSWSPAISFHWLSFPIQFRWHPPVVYGDFLYWVSAQYLYKWDGISSDIDAKNVQNIGGQFLIQSRPKIINEKLFVFPTSLIYAFTAYLDGPPNPNVISDELWTLVPGGIFQASQSFQLFSVSIGDRTLVLDEHRATILKKGALSVSDEETLSNRLISGGQNIDVLNFKMAYNFEERVKNIRLENTGSAISQRDITQLKLVDARGLDQKTIVKFDRVGEKHWQFPHGFEWTPENNVQYHVVADISNSATPGTSVAIAIPPHGVEWDINKSYQLTHPVQSHSEQFIVSEPSPAPDLVSDVIIYPTPARDDVQFMYDLSSGGDVTIRIFDESGDLVSEINEHQKSPDSQAVTTWNARTMAPDIYFALIQIHPLSGEKRVFKKSVLVDR